METILKTTDLAKVFKSKIAVKKMNMTINRGDIYGFIGKNGAGKTTLMRMVLGMAYPTSGDISLFGGLSHEQAGKKIGSLIETPGLYTSVSAFENMKRFAIFTGDSDVTILKLLERVGLSYTGKLKVKKFSLGMRQRLALAIVLLGEPEFIILDEPTLGIDPQGVKELRDIILTLNKEKGVTFLIASHLLDELSKIATKFGIINNGVLVEEIDSSELNQKCTKTLHIKVNDSAKAYNILLSVIPENEMTRTETAIYLNSHLDQSAQINALLIKNEVLVSSIELHSKSLEDYFIERIGK